MKSGSLFSSTHLQWDGDMTRNNLPPTVCSTTARHGDLPIRLRPLLEMATRLMMRGRGSKGLWVDGPSNSSTHGRPLHSYTMCLCGYADIA